MNDRKTILRIFLNTSPKLLFSFITQALLFCSAQYYKLFSASVFYTGNHFDHSLTFWRKVGPEKLGQTYPQIFDLDGKSEISKFSFEMRQLRIKKVLLNRSPILRQIFLSSTHPWTSTIKLFTLLINTAILWPVL
jgi:hypothetical protein